MTLRELVDVIHERFIVYCYNLYFKICFKTNFCFLSDQCYESWMKIHRLLKPVRCRIASEIDGQLAFGRIKKNAKKASHTYTKLFTVEDSIKSTILILKENQDFRAEVLKFAQEKKRQKMHFHPVMGVFLNEDNKPYSFVLFINDIVIQLTTFEELLKMFVRTLFLFNMEYSSEGRLACKFLAYILFKYEEEDSAGWGRVRSLAAEFNLFKNK